MSAATIELSATARLLQCRLGTPDGEEPVIAEHVVNLPALEPGAYLVQADEAGGEGTVEVAFTVVPDGALPFDCSACAR